MATVASQCTQDLPPSEAGLSGGPKHTTSAYEFTWAVGSKLWQELFPPGCLPSPSRVICSFPRSQWSLLFPTAEASSLLHLPSFTPLMFPRLHQLKSLDLTPTSLGPSHHSLAFFCPSFGRNNLFGRVLLCLPD